MYVWSRVLEETMPDNSPVVEKGHSDLSRIDRYNKLAALIQEWSEEPGDYDERTWPYIEEALKESALKCTESNESN